MERAVVYKDPERGWGFEKLAVSDDGLDTMGVLDEGLWGYATHQLALADALTAYPENVPLDVIVNPGDYPGKTTATPSVEIGAPSATAGAGPVDE